MTSVSDTGPLHGFMAQQRKSVASSPLLTRLAEQVSDALFRPYSRSPKNLALQLQPFFQKSHTPTVPKEFKIGLHDSAEADSKNFWNCCRIFGEWLYSNYSIMCCSFI